MLVFLIFFVSPLLADSGPGVTTQADLAIVKRSEWGAKPSRSNNGLDGVNPLKKKPAPFVIIHHTATPECTTRADCESRVRNIQDYHMNTNLWADIGYNFLIGGDGNVYEGRGWGKAGAHAVGYNSKSIGVCLIGDYQNTTPPENILEAAKNLIAHGVSVNEISSNYTLKGHRQVFPTQCPGNKLYDAIQTWPRWVSGM